ncbi:MAG: hypothetical protein Solivirus7_10 [Solivirus sp.]|uniref:Uncharacterized protein n=1 Tax=Solivirus sp. TaxID=2487772 RepID=A0A3G5AG20_9VIRU|nr:MAG: hypothetical protein Solivirus7_10 [Solivirus sp.]
MSRSFLPIVIIEDNKGENSLFLYNTKVMTMEYQRAPDEFLPHLPKRERRRIYTHSLLWKISAERKRSLSIIESNTYTNLSDDELMEYLTFNNKQLDTEMIGDAAIFFYGKYESECGSHVEEAGIKERKIYKTNSAFGAYAYMINPEAAAIALLEINKIERDDLLDEFFQQLCSKELVKAYCYHPSILKSATGYTAECLYPIDEKENRKKRNENSNWLPILIFILIIILIVILILALYYVARICFSSSNIYTIHLRDQLESE